MQSSPPPPAPPPHKPLPPPHKTPFTDQHDETQYSLDLDALTLDGDDSDTSIPSVHPVVDRIHSDDIDGPTDFTVNLAKYFRGTPQKKPIPAWQKEQDKVDESVQFLHDESPRQQDASSVLSTPRPAEKLPLRQKRDLLQPTVEDYYSDLTPGRPVSFNDSLGSVQRRSASTSQLQQSSVLRPSSPPTASFAPSPFPSFESTPDRRSRHLEQELVQLGATNESLRQQLESERASRKDPQEDGSTNRDGSQELNILRSELSRIESQARDYEGEINNLHQQLDQARAAERDVQRLADDRAKEIEQYHDTEDAELHNLRVRLNQTRDAEQALKEQLEEQRKEMEKNAETNAAETSRLRSQLEQYASVQEKAESALRTLMKATQDSEAKHNQEIQRLKQELKDAHDQAQRSREEYEEDLDISRNKVDKQHDDSTQQDLRHQLSSLQDDLDVARNEASGYKQERDHFQTTHEDLEKQLQEARDELANRDQLIEITREETDRKAANMTQSLSRQLDQAKQQLATRQPTPTPPVQEDFSIKANEALQQLEQQLQKTRDELATLQTQYASDKNTWQEADTEARNSKTQILDRYKQEQQARQKAEEESNSLREEIEMLHHFNQMTDEDTAAPSKPISSDLTESLRKELQSLRQQLQEQQEQYTKDMTALQNSLAQEADMRKDHRRTIDLIEEGMTSLRSSRDDLRLRVNTLEKVEADLAACRAELSALKTELSATKTEVSATKAELSIIKTDLSTTKTELSTTKTELSTSQAELQAAKTKLTTTNTDFQAAKPSSPSDQPTSDLEAKLQQTTKQLAELHLLNSDFDIRLADSLKKREESWRQKLKEMKVRAREAEEKARVLEEERRKMVKALMGSWGREEFGDGERDGQGREREGQKFRYRFGRGERAGGDN